MVRSKAKEFIEGNGSIMDASDMLQRVIAYAIKSKQKSSYNKKTGKVLIDVGKLGKIEVVEASNDPALYIKMSSGGEYKMDFEGFKEFFDCFVRARKTADNYSH